MNTKTNILQTALNLFNDQGTEVITVRHIAKEVGISHGNLCYHFPNTDVIISQLYDELVEKLNYRLDTVPADLSLETLLQSARQSMALLYDYRFLMLDFAGIMRRIPTLRDKHRILVARRKTVFRQILSQLRAADSIRPELYPNYDEDLLEQLFIVGDFWLSSATILYDGPTEQKISYYQRIFLSLLIPLLTARGMAEWQLIHESP